MAEPWTAMRIRRPVSFAVECMWLPVSTDGRHAYRRSVQMDSAMHECLFSLELDNNGVLYAGGGFFEWTNGYYMSRACQVGRRELDERWRGTAGRHQFNRWPSMTMELSVCGWSVQQMCSTATDRQRTWSEMERVCLLSTHNAGVGAEQLDVYDVWRSVSNKTVLAGGQFTSAGDVATNRVGLVYPLTAYDPGTHPSIRIMDRQL